MQLILYAGGSFLTGDDIADALLEYGRALGADNKAEVVRIPIIGDDRLPATATFLIGPASQIVATSVRSDEPEPQDPALVERMRALTARINSPAGAPLDSYGGQDLDDI